MPPQPLPRAAHLIPSEESSSDKAQSPIPPLSQSRARRQRQRAGLPSAETPQLPPSTPDTPEESKPKLINKAFIAKIRENDTLARFQRLSPVPADSGSTDGNVELLAFARARTVHLQIAARMSALANGDARIACYRVRRQQTTMLSNPKRRLRMTARYPTIVKST